MACASRYEILLLENLLQKVAFYKAKKLLNYPGSLLNYKKYLLQSNKKLVRYPGSSLNYKKTSTDQKKTT